MFPCEFNRSLEERLTGAESVLERFVTHADDSWVAHIFLILESGGFMSYNAVILNQPACSRRGVERGSAVVSGGVILSGRPVLGRESKDLLFPISRRDLLKWRVQTSHVIHIPDLRHSHFPRRHPGLG